MKIDSEILINCQNSDEENDDNGTELRITDLTWINNYAANYLIKYVMILV